MSALVGGDTSRGYCGHTAEGSERLGTSRWVGADRVFMSLVHVWFCRDIYAVEMERFYVDAFVDG